MKHQRIIKQILAFILSITIMAISCMSYSVPVHAVEKTYTSWADFRDDATASIFYLYSQVGAIFGDHDFVTYIQNKDEWANYWNEDNVIIDEETNEVTFSADLVSYLKEALTEYQNEQYGYQILPTIKYDQVPVSDCFDSYEYRSMCELACKYGMIGYLHSSVGAYNFTDFSKYLDGQSGFYMYAYDTTSYRVAEMDLLTWSQGTDYQFPYYAIKYADNQNVLYTWDDVADAAYATGSKFGTWNGTYSGSYLKSSNELIISAHGEDILVFNSATSLKNYSVEKRGVFTTSGFYEDTGALTVNVDDLNNSIGDLADILDQFRAVIGEQEGSLTEAELEALLEKFLDEFFNRLSGDGNGSSDGNGNDNGNGDSSSGSDIDIPSGFFDSIVDYCNSVLDYLSSILEQLKSIKRWTVVDTVIDGEDAIADWLSLIHDVLSDADAGAKTAVASLSSALSDAAGMLKSKFPFSIPWDILSLVAILAADPEPPYFEVPFHVDLSLLGCTVDYTFEIDFTQFQWLSDILRALLSMTYAVGLMKMTSGIATIKKEE